MPIRPELALQVKGIELPDPLAMQAQATQIQNALQQQRMGEMQIQNAMREQRREQDYETVLSGFKPGMSLEERVAALQQRGLGAKGAQYAKTQLEMEKERRLSQKAGVETEVAKYGLFGQLLSNVTDQASLDAALPQIARIPGMTEQDLAQLSVYNKPMIEFYKNAALTVYQRGSLANQQEQARAAGTRAQAAVSQAATAADRAKFERENPGFTIQETDKGLFKVNKRTGATEPLMQDGEQLKAPERRPLVQVTPGESAFNQAIGTGLGRQVVKDLEAAQTAPSIANRANNVLAAIDENKAFVGPASQFKLQLARALNVTGKGPSEQIAATESLIADLKQAVIEAIKASNLGTGNGFTNKDLDFLVKAKAADIANDPKTLAEFARRAYLTAEEAAKLGTKIVETNEQVKRQYQGRSFEVPSMFQSSGKSGVRRGTAAAAEDGGRREIEPGVFVTERP
jgi:hypothetical protein